ncbi:MAG: HAMP domain-containing histidine kinase, partial [Pedobacter sp.]
ELIAQRVDELQHTSASHRMMFQAKGKITVTADKERIGQVLTNLISNAIKYSPEGNIILDSRQKDGTVEVCVRDFGIGIAVDLKEKIFDRFYRVRSVSIDTYPGMGLGLYISAAIIKRHGGEIWVESPPLEADGKTGKGAAFYFRIPVSKKPEL